jgi:threonine dehydrogenase-like Zn-dependent dehydrogenase
MKAIRIHGSNDTRYEDVADPKTGPDDVLIKVRAAGICGTDLELADGSMFYLTSGTAELPLIPGHEWSGEVVAVGSAVDEFAIGDRVTGECTVSCMQCDYCLRGWYNQCPNRTETGILNRDGGFAELIAFPRQFLHKCDGLEFEDAAFIEPTGIAIYPIKLANVTPADRVAVMGPGPIGLFAVQVLKAYGARTVILVGTRDERLEIGRDLGADVTVNIRREHLVEKVRAATEGNMVDVVVEAAGTPSVWEDIVSIVAPRARIAMTGLFAGERCAVDFDPVVVNNLSVLGCLGSPNLWDEAISLHQRGLVSSLPLITHRLPLSEFQEAVDIVRERRDGAIKAVLAP